MGDNSHEELSTPNDIEVIRCGKLLGKFYNKAQLFCQFYFEFILNFSNRSGGNNISSRESKTSHGSTKPNPSAPVPEQTPASKPLEQLYRL
jgi:hypothetical protein